MTFRQRFPAPPLLFLLARSLCRLSYARAGGNLSDEWPGLLRSKWGRSHAEYLHDGWTRFRMQASPLIFDNNCKIVSLYAANLTLYFTSSPASCTLIPLHPPLPTCSHLHLSALPRRPPTRAPLTLFPHPSPTTFPRSHCPFPCRHALKPHCKAIHRSVRAWR